ncbi:MAG: lysylphosphatidylglycerol synthase transmembrane domain-containing protein [Thiohalomonadales bacterium]
MKAWLTLSVKLIISACLLGLVFYFIPFANVISSLRTAELSWVAAALGLGVLQTYLSAARLKILTDKQGINARYADIVNINFIGTFYGTILPGELASGVIRWQRLYQIDHKGHEALSAIIFARFISTVYLVLFGILFSLLDDVRSHFNLLVSIFFFIFMGLMLVCLIGTIPQFTTVLARFEKAMPQSLQRILQKQLSAIGRFRQLPRRTILAVSIISSLEHLVGIFLILFLAYAVSAEITFVQIGWLRSAVVLVQLLPVSFSGLGVREGTIVLLLQPYGIEGAQAVSLSLLLFGKNLFIGAIGGIIEVKSLIVSLSKDS